LSSQSGWIDRFRQWPHENKIAVTQSIPGATIPSKKSGVEVTSWLLRKKEKSRCAI
jgi:hypothetical protein